MITFRHLGLMAVFSATSTLPAQTAPEPVLTTVTAVLALDGRDAAASPRPVRLKGVVLGVSTKFNFFSLHDGTSAVGVMRHNQGLKQGDLVEVTGQTTVTNFNGTLYPRVVAESVTVTGAGELPEPRLVNIKTFSQPVNYDQWVSLEGHVVDWQYRSPELKLLLVTGDGYVETYVTLSDATLLPRRLHGARLCATGTVVSIPTPLRVLFVPGPDQLEVLEAGTEDIFDAPLASFQEVLQRKVEAGKRWRVRGVFAARTQQRRVILTSPEGAMLTYLLLPRGPEEPSTIYGDAGPWPQMKPGDVVEMVGSIVDMSGTEARKHGLYWCYARVLGHEAAPRPESMDIETVGRLRNDDRWVSVEGVVDAWSWQGGVMTYSVAGPGQMLQLGVRDVASESFARDLHGARLRFTGITTSLMPDASGTSLLVPDPSFVETLGPGREDRFLTPERTVADIAGSRVPVGGHVRAKGVLTGRVGRVLYLRGEGGALCASLHVPAQPVPGALVADAGAPPEFGVGDELEIVGLTVRNPDHPDYAPFDLVNASVRVLGHQEQVAPVAATLAEVARGAHTAELVEVRGRLVTLRQTPFERGEWRATLLLDAGGVKLPAVFQNSVPGSFDTIHEDDDVLVRGFVDRATPRDPRQIWLLSPGDVTSLGISPAVIKRRLWLWCGGTVSVLALLLGWITVLRRAGRVQDRAAAELKAASDAAQESERRWKLLFEQSPLSVQIFAPDGQTKRFNQAWKNLFRLNDDQGHAFNVLTDPDLNASGAVNLIRRAFEGEVVHVPPVPFPIPGDPPEHRWIGGVLYPVKNEAGEIMEVVTVHNDITEQKRAEEAMLAINQTLEQRVNERTAELEKAQAEISRALDQERELGELKSRFVTMVSHEFRTPLGIIMSAVELMRHYDERLPQEQRQELQMDIFNATRLMAGLMEQVLVLGRVEAGKLGCKAMPCDLSTLAGKLTDESLSATNRKCIVTWQAEGDLSDAIADEALLRHIFSNLITNAVKYSPEGSEVMFTARREGDDAVFQVIDRGIGIPEADRERLFEAFHRCSNVGEIPGTGLGLVIVKRCVDLHGGVLQIDSTVGQGTTFTVRLPLFGK